MSGHKMAMLFYCFHQPPSACHGHLRSTSVNILSLINSFLSILSISPFVFLIRTIGKNKQKTVYKLGKYKIGQSIDSIDGVYYN